jgi:hypothetical protein
MPGNDELKPGDQIGLLFENTMPDGTRYFKGTSWGRDVVMFKGKKAAKSGAAMWNLLISKPKKGREPGED